MRLSFIDRYSAQDSPLHILDPRSKLLAFAALIIAILHIPMNDSVLFFIYFFVTAILMGISQVPLNFIMGRTLVILPFIVLASLAVPGKGWFWLGVLFVRTFLCLVLLILLINTTRFPELLRGLRKLGCPLILVMKLRFLYHYLFVLAEEAMRMKRARDCMRAGSAPFRAELKIVSSMPATLLTRSFERTERRHAAMLSRAFDGEFPVYLPRRFGWPDLAFLSGIGFFVALTYLKL
jgi:cobalt/nickel transport system permease protein